MRIQKENAGSVNLAKRVLGLSVAMLTSAAAFMVAVPGAQAVTYDQNEDSWFPAKQGIQTGIDYKVTLVKYLTSNTGGGNPTGSVKDEAAAKQGAKVAEGVVFKLSTVVPSVAGNPGTMDPTKTSSYIRQGPAYVGATNSAGKITTGTASGPGTWKEFTSGNAEAVAKDSSTPGVRTLPNDGIHYYLLEEVAGVPDGAKASAPVIFSVPFRATDDNNVDGYIYHVHIYPKNTSENQLMKKASDINRGGRGTWESTSKDGTAHVQAGDRIRYHVTHALLNDGGKPNDGKLDVAEAKNANANPWLVIWDRMSPALTMVGSPVVNVTYKDASGNTVSNSLTVGTDYQFVSSSSNPKSLDNSVSMFPGPQNETGVQYVGIQFGSGQKGWLNAIPSDATSVMIDMLIEAEVGSNDVNASDPGMLVNKAAADHVENKDQSGNKKDPERAEEKTHSAGFQFAKVDSKGDPIKNNPALFYLADINNPTMFLHSDGKFYSENSNSIPSGVKIIDATSNSNGIVTFVGIPISDPNDSSKIAAQGAPNLNFALVERKAPAGYKRIPVEFKKVTYDSKGGLTWESAMAANPKGIDRDKGGVNNSPDPLNLGSYGQIVNLKNGDGSVVTTGLKNWKEGEEGEPISLPLTGGKGIILLLVVGLAIMGGVLVLRNRKNAVKRV